MTLRAGVAIRDITPRPGTAMSGFVAREAAASGVHDPLLVYALAVDHTALVTVDVVGLHEEDCAEIRRRCCLPAGNVIVHATHTHGGPVSMRGRLGDRVDETWLKQTIQACVDCVDAAAANQEPAEPMARYGENPGVARNRRRTDGPVDDTIPVLLLNRADGSVLAGLTSYACHPVVLGADNTLLTADYPGVVRRVMAQQLDDAPVLFATGCAGDANTGHTAAASISTAAATNRTFQECERVGKRIAAAALAGTPPAHLTLRSTERTRVPAASPAIAASGEVLLGLDVSSRQEILADVERWEREAASADPAHRALLRCWIRWGQELTNDAGSKGHYRLHGAAAPDARASWRAPLTVLRWGEAVLVALPGEPFAAAAQQIRQHAARAHPHATILVIGFSNGCPGYLPTLDEYSHGGYEVSDAHRYYGMPGPFTKGSAEALIHRATQLLDRLP